MRAIFYLCLFILTLCVGIIGNNYLGMHFTLREPHVSIPTSCFPVLWLDNKFSNSVQVSFARGSVSCHCFFELINPSIFSV